MSESKLNIDDKIEAKIQFLGRQLKQSNLKPVKRKVFKMIESRLTELREAVILNKSTGSAREAMEANINDILESISLFLPENAAWDVADSLKEFLLKVASDNYLYKSLVEEKGRQKPKMHLWSDYYSESSLKKLIAKYEKGKTIPSQLVKDRLSSLYKFRNDLGRHDRAREGMRALYLRFMAGILLCGIIIVAMLWQIAANCPKSAIIQLIVVAVSGAIGALLSGTMRLRQLNLIVDIHNLWWTLFSQAILGSTLAVIVLLILKTEIIIISGFELENPDAAIFFVIGLISGFSEPFALGILERVAKMGN